MCMTSQEREEFQNALYWGFGHKIGLLEPYLTEYSRCCRETGKRVTNLKTDRLSTFLYTVHDTFCEVASKSMPREDYYTITAIFSNALAEYEVAHGWF